MQLLPKVQVSTYSTLGCAGLYQDICFYNNVDNNIIIM